VFLCVFNPKPKGKKNSFFKNVKVVIFATFTMHQLSTTCILKVEGGTIITIRGNQYKQQGDDE
jgi:hypothetical protein